MRLHKLNRATQLVDFDASDRPETAFEQMAKALARQQREARYAAYRDLLMLPPAEPSMDDDVWHDFMADEALEEFSRRPLGTTARSRPSWFGDHSLASWLVHGDRLLTGRSTGPMAQASTATSLTFHLALGEMAMAATVESVKERVRVNGELTTETRLADTVKVKVSGDGRTRWGRIVMQTPTEKSVWLIDLPDASQALAQAAVDLWAGFMEAQHPIETAEFLAVRGACVICARPLSDEVSKAIGVGPDCAAHYGVPHSVEAANRVQAARIAKAQEYHRIWGRP